MLISIYLIYLAFVMICLGMDKHYKSVMTIKENKTLKKIFKTLGILLLTITFFILMYNEGISLGITYWIGIAAPAITLIAMILNYKAKLLPLISVVFFIVLCIIKYI